MMTKQDLQKELLEKLRPGVKASDIKKLKRSKSAGDIPSAPPSPTTQIKQLEDKISVLELIVETKDRELTEKDGTVVIYSDQLNQKQKGIENLRQSLDQKTAELKKTKQELDNSLFARVEAVKQFGKIHEKLKQIKQELNENVEQASEELINQDKKINQYRTNQQKVQQKIKELEQDLNLAQRLAELRKYPLPDNSPNLDYLKYALYSLATVGFTL